jgi:hypothetical protein
MISNYCSTEAMHIITDITKRLRLLMLLQSEVLVLPWDFDAASPAGLNAPLFRGFVSLATVSQERRRMYEGLWFSMSLDNTSPSFTLHRNEDSTCGWIMQIP